KAGGAERAFAALARQLPAHGFEPLAALLEPGPLHGWLDEAGCEVSVVPERDAYDWLRQSIRRTRARLVVSSKWEGQGVAGVAAAAASIPSVWWQHDVARPSPGQLEAASIPAAVVVCGSDYAVREQRRLTPDVRVARVYAGVPVATIAARSGSGRAVR